MPLTSVYRFFDASGQLLYVGVSLTPLHRFTQHRNDKDWWEEVDQIKVKTYPTRQEAFAREATAIIDEGPRYNLARPKQCSAKANGSKPRPEDPSGVGAEIRALSEMVRQLIRERDEAIRVARAEGHSLRQIAEWAGLSHGTVAKITRSQPKEQHR